MKKLPVYLRDILSYQNKKKWIDIYMYTVHHEFSNNKLHDDEQSVIVWHNDDEQSVILGLNDDEQSVTAWQMMTNNQW